MSIYLMEKSYVIASIFKTKHLHFRENFVTLKECNVISRLLQKEYNNRNINVCITNAIDNDYFKVFNGIIVLNKDKNIDLQSIEQRYQGYVSNFDILLELWNDEFILKNLEELRGS